MMQYGAAIADRLPLKAIANSRALKILDEMPGWLGDARAGEDGAGELALGATAPLDPQRVYACFEHDHHNLPRRRYGAPVSQATQLTDVGKAR